jgi:hypothetical protein
MIRYRFVNAADADGASSFAMQDKARREVPSVVLFGL